jgi:hypothetical protein
MEDKVIQATDIHYRDQVDKGAKVIDNVPEKMELCQAGEEDTRKSGQHKKIRTIR